MSDIKPSHNIAEFSVSEISNALKRVVESNFSYVRVRGEISGYRGPHSSGHCYFSLKDDKSKIDAIVWKGSFQQMRYKPEEGMEVIATGKLSTFAGKSSYQIIIEAMEPAGEGALMALLEKRKKELAAEGLFDPARKKPLPYLPQTIGVVTSPTGAVIRDILHRLADRMPSHVLLWPVAVQGEGAAAQVAKAIEGFNRGQGSEVRSQEGDNLTSDIRHLTPDVIIVARGGGSIEDLWPFNEEIVVRAVAASEIPVISAVGHETDTTLIDYVSDQRAPTPTAAAEMAVPVRADLLYTLRDHQQRMDSLLTNRLAHAKQRVEGLSRGLPRPTEILANARQSLDVATDKLANSLKMLITAKQHKLSQAALGLRPTLLQQPIREQSRRVFEAQEKLNERFTRLIERKQNQLQNLTGKLALLDYQNVLKRGYALVKNAQGQLITSVTAAADAASLTFHDGEAKLGSTSVTPPAPKKQKPKKPQPAFDELQESLF